ncbi:putative glucosamine 6-phosphate N-acetyltransferase [Choanephora cucurbitarum]|uniref:Putative glucosamine 6-phosphate N-acetyltransferase n=1 Tax=Choanephora cucurbitarum TaxID=101091 RepID=A0A1C7NDF6_9FUNG|nr:putative glucosamine 6-phosphate N-acetyltransferase [Choanephora cucurbitarum]
MYTIRQLEQEETTDTSISELYKLLSQLSSSVTKVAIWEAIGSEQNHILIATTTDGKLVGTATMAYLRCLTGTRVHIEDVVVDQAHRGKGIATLLLTEIIQRAKELKAKSIDLTSRPDKIAANQLYRKLGFVQRETNVYRYQQ